MPVAMAPAPAPTAPMNAGGGTCFALHAPLLSRRKILEWCFSSLNHKASSTRKEVEEGNPGLMTCKV